MAYIKTLKDNELIGGQDNTDVYPITSTQAVYSQKKDGSAPKDKKVLLEERLADIENQIATPIGTDDIVDEAIVTRKIADNAITTSKIDNGAVTSEKIASNAVTNDKIANGTITGDKFTDDSIDGSKIKDNSVPGSKLADGAIESIDLQDNTLSGSKLADNSVDGDKLVDGAVTSNKLKDNSIDGSKITDGTIQSLDIKDGTISGAKLVNGTITGDKLANGIIDNNKIANNTITGDKFLDESISGEKIQANTIHGSKLETGTVDGADIIAGTLNGNKIADMSVDGDKLVDDSIETRHIKSNTISGSKIVTNSIDGTKIRNNSLIGENFKEGVITTAKIADNAVTNSKIADNTIASDKIADGAITTAKLANGSIGGTSIADNAITNAKLQDNSIVNRNIATGTLTGDKFVDNTITGDKIIDNTIPGSKIKDGTIENVDIKDNTLSGTKLVDNSINGSKIADNAITSSHLMDNSIPASKILDGTIESIDIKDGTLDGSKIKDNTITGAKLVDGAIVSGKLATDAVTTNKIANEAVTTAKINDDAVTTDKIASNAVTTDKIADTSVETPQIADNAIVTAKIANGAIDTLQIANGAVTENKLGTGSVTTNKIVDNAVTTNKLADENVTTAKLADGAVTEDKLADGAITPEKIADSTITELQTIMDEVPTVGSVKPITSRGVLAHGSAFDISEYNKNEGTLATYATLADALAAIPSSVYKGGMSIKYVHTSDNNYVQFRYIGTSIADADFVTISNWKNAELYTPKDGSPIEVNTVEEAIDNLIEIAAGNTGEYTPIFTVTDGKKLGPYIVNVSGYRCTSKIPLLKGDVITYTADADGLSGSYSTIGVERPSSPNNYNVLQPTATGVTNTYRYVCAKDGNYVICSKTTTAITIKVISQSRIVYGANLAKGTAFAPENSGLESTDVNDAIIEVEDNRKATDGKIGNLNLLETDNRNLVTAINDVNKKAFGFVKLRVAQYNIGGFGNGDSGTHITPEEADTKALEYRTFFNKNAHADIFCVSEYNSKFHTGEASESNNPRLYCFPNYREWNISVDYGYYCNAQFYNLPYSIVDKFIDGTGADMKVVSVAQINGKRVYIINCHLPYDSQPNPQPPTGTNLAAFESLLNFCKDLDHVILCGDFNARLDSYYDMFKSAGFEMANSGILGLLQTEPDYTITHTTGHVDNIMVKGFTINDIWLEPLVHDEAYNREKTESGLSDHCLLCAEIVMQNPNANIVDFYDNTVKSVLLSHFDTNNDGEITYNEMRNITDVSTYFNNYVQIKDTRDLVFAKITTLKGSFLGCTGLENVIIPSSVTAFQGFRELPKVKSIFILQPSVVSKKILVESIYNLPNLEVIDFPERCNRINGYSLFYNMQSTFNVVLRKKDDIVEITSSDVSGVPKNVFVPQSLISTYEASSRYAAWVGKFKAIGGEDWVNEFGSADEYADYIKYGMEKFIGM